MKTRTGWIAGLAIAALAAGCGREEPPETFAAREAMRARVEAMGREMGDLRQELETLRRAHTTDIKSAIQEVFGDELNRTIVSQIHARVEAKIGTEADVQRSIRTAVADAVVHHEQQKQQAEEAMREEQRLARERERAERDEQRWAQIAEELRLTTAQTDQLRAASQAARAEIEAVMESLRSGGARLDVEQMRAQATELKTQFEHALGQILSPEQIEAYRNQGFNVLRMLDGIIQGRGGPPRGPTSSRGDSSAGRR